MPDKKTKDKMDPSIAKAIVKLNLALQTTLQRAIADLCVMLRFFPGLSKVISDAIDEAEEALNEINQNKSADLKKNATAMIKIARVAYKEGQKAASK